MTALLHLRLILLLVLVVMVDPARILLTAPCPGSHYFTVLQLATLLSNHGHNITLVTPFQDTRLLGQQRGGSGVRVLVPEQHSYPMSTFTKNTAEPCVRSLFTSKSGRTMYTDTMFGETCMPSWVWLYRTNVELYTSPWFQDLLRTGQFDAIIAEEKTFLPVATVNRALGIPLAVYISEIGVYLIRAPLNLPSLMNSEPGIFHQVFRGRKPSFWERLVSTYKVYTGAPRIHGEIEKMLKPKMAAHGVSSVQELYKQISLYFVNDYIAFSFPYLYPNNVIQAVAPLHYTAKSLEQEIQVFIDRQDQPVLYVSLGSYVEWDWIPWFDDFVEAIKAMNVAIIMKSEHNYGLITSEERIFYRKWLPQRDILASGRVSLFVSHCGNNGRIEGILSKVPILCLPIFAEQNLNGELVSRNRFGEMLLPEEISKQSLVDIIGLLIHNRSEYVGALERALDIFYSEPSSVGQKIIHGVNLLVKYGNMKHLINEIIQEQTLIEVYNLDIISMAVILTAVLGTAVIKILLILVGIISVKK